MVKQGEPGRIVRESVEPYTYNANEMSKPSRQYVSALDTLET